mgnify:CR=1 FL=1
MTLWQKLRARRRKGDAAAEAAPSLLTARETDVFRLLVEGYTLQETADRLGVKYSTVNTHVTALYKKLGVRSRAELIIGYRDYEKENKR